MIFMVITIAVDCDGVDSHNVTILGYDFEVDSEAPVVIVIVIVVVIVIIIVVVAGIVRTVWCGRSNRRTTVVIVVIIVIVSKLHNHEIPAFPASLVDAAVYSCMLLGAERANPYRTTM